MWVVKTKKKIIILGSSGFIGGWLFKRFSSIRDYYVVGFSSKECNLLSQDSIKNALSSIKPDDIIIMASSITRLRENSFKTMLKNIQMAENIAQFIDKHPVAQFIFLSTVDVYGILKDDVIINESLLTNPNDYYAVSKLVSEFILKKQCAKKKIPLTTLRLSGVYGPGDDGKSTINILIRSVFDTGRICIFGDGKDTRDFVYVDDVYKIINGAIRCRLNLTLNVATGDSESIVDIVSIIKSLLPERFSVEFRPQDNKSKKRIRNMIYDISLLKSKFPDFKFKNLKEGISLYIGAYNQNK